MDKNYVYLLYHGLHSDLILVIDDQKFCFWGPIFKVANVLRNQCDECHVMFFHAKIKQCILYFIRREWCWFLVVIQLSPLQGFTHMANIFSLYLFKSVRFYFKLSCLFMSYECGMNAFGVKVHAHLKNDYGVWPMLYCMCDVENDVPERNEKGNENLVYGDVYFIVYAATKPDTSLKVFIYYSECQLMLHRSTNVHRIILLSSHAARYGDFLVYDKDVKCILSVGHIKEPHNFLKNG